MYFSVTPQNTKDRKKFKSWPIKNFKPIVDSGELQLAPVTVFAGRNSSGKSSLLQSILMVSQTLGSRLLDRPLLPNERLVQLGTFEDILSEFADSRELELGFGIEFEKEEEVWYDDEGEPWPNLGPFVSSVQTLVTFRSGNLRNMAASAIGASKVFVEKAFIKAMPSEPLYVSRSKRLAEVAFISRNIGEQRFDEIYQGLSTEKKRRFSHNMEQTYYIGQFTDDSEGDKNAYISEMSHFFPSSLEKRIDEYEIVFQQARNIVQALLDAKIGENNRASQYDLELSRGTKSVLGIFCKERKIDPDILGKTFQDMVSFLKNTDIGVISQEDHEMLINLITSDLADEISFIGSPDEDKESFILNTIACSTRFFANQIRYLGPIREKADIIRQGFAPTGDLDDIGFNGEYAAIVYHSNKNQPIEWHNPSTQQVQKSTLAVALDTWAQYLTIAAHISTEEAGVVGITWKIVMKEGQKARFLSQV